MYIQIVHMPIVLLSLLCTSLLLLISIQRVAPVVLVVQSSAVVNHAREHVKIPEYTDHIRAYMDLGNQGVTNSR